MTPGLDPNAALRGACPVPGNAGQRGFTLLEVILAFALLAAGLGLLLGLQSRGLQQIRWAGDASEASLHAQSKLDAIGALEYIEPGQSEGEFEDGRYRWTLDIREVEDPVPLAEASASPVLQQPADLPVLYRVALNVRWGRATTKEQIDFIALRARRPQVVAAGGPK